MWLSQRASRRPERAVPSTVDARNQRTWSDPATLAAFADLQGWTDAGERIALGRVAAEARGRGVLDVGAGAGRTAGFLRLLSDDYVAVDYTPEMVDAFRRNHPDLEVHLGDARDLSAFQHARFGLVVFSFNGIDAVGHDDRRRVLAELHRVLLPGGWLLYSTHNKLGPGAHEGPWRGPRFDAPSWWRVARWSARLPRELPRHRRAWRNWWANRSLREEGGEWAMRTCGAHDFGIVIHYTTLAGVLAETRSAGFVEVDVLGRERGQSVDLNDDVAHVRWFQVLARKPVG